MSHDSDGHVATCASCEETLDASGQCSCTRQPRIKRFRLRRGQAIKTGSAVTIVPVHEDGRWYLEVLGGKAWVES